LATVTAVVVKVISMMMGGSCDSGKCYVSLIAAMVMFLPFLRI